MEKVLLKEESNIKNLIYEIRGVQVILDRDLALLYECKNGTKDINKAVKRNIERFPEDFYFQLNNEELTMIFSRFQFGTLKNKEDKRGYNIKYLPYAFTEQGVSMLSSVLRTEVASKVSVDIMRAFVSMRHHLSNNEYRLFNIESKLVEHDKNIKLLQESFDKLLEKKKVNEIYFDGQIYDAYSKILDIFKLSKKELIIIDSYADKSLLDIIKNLKVQVTIITKKNNLLKELDIKKYNEQYENLNVVYDNTFHDRYFIIDKKEVYHCGASINRIGHKTFSITLLSDIEVCESLLNKINKIL